MSCAHSCDVEPARGRGRRRRGTQLHAGGRGPDDDPVVAEPDRRAGRTDLRGPAVRAHHPAARADRRRRAVRRGWRAQSCTATRRRPPTSRRYLAGTKGVLRLAALPSLAVSLLPPMITRFRARHPDIMVEVEDVLAGQITRLRTQRRGRSGGHRRTTGIAPHGHAARPGSASTPSPSTTSTACLSDGHRLLDQPTIDWTDLNGEAFIAFDESSSVRRIVDQALVSRGVVRRHV